MINILVFNIGLLSRPEEKEKLITYSKFVNMVLFDFKRQRPGKFKVKIETSQAELGSGLSRGLLMCRCHLSNYTATHELFQVLHL